MSKTINPFEMPEEMRKAIDSNMGQAKAGFEKLMDVAGQAARTLDTKAGAAQDQALDMREKTLAYTKANVNAAFELAAKLTKAQSLDEVMRLQADYMTRQFTTLNTQIKDAGASLQAQTKAAAAEIVENTKGMQAAAKAAMENVANAAKPKKGK